MASTNPQPPAGGGGALSAFIARIPEEEMKAMPKTAQSPPAAPSAQESPPAMMMMRPPMMGGGMQIGPHGPQPMGMHMMRGPPMMMQGMHMMRGPPMMMHQQHMMMARGHPRMMGPPPMAMQPRRDPRGAQPPLVELNLSTVLAPPGTPITLRWKFAGPGREEAQANDWVGLFHRDVVGSTRAMTTRDAYYGNASRVRGHLNFRTPRAAGTYNFRYFRTSGDDDYELARTETLRVTMQWGAALAAGLKYIVSHLSDPANLVSVAHQFMRVVRQLEDFRVCIEAAKDAPGGAALLVDAAYASVDDMWAAVRDLVHFAFQFDAEQGQAEAKAEAHALKMSALVATATAAAEAVALRRAAEQAATPPPTTISAALDALDAEATAAAEPAPTPALVALEAEATLAAEAAAAAQRDAPPRRTKQQNYIDAAAGVIFAVVDSVFVVGALDVERRAELTELKARIQAAERKQTAQVRLHFFCFFCFVSLFFSLLISSFLLNRTAQVIVKQAAAAAAASAAASATAAASVRASGGGGEKAEAAAAAIEAKDAAARAAKAGYIERVVAPLLEGRAVASVSIATHLALNNEARNSARELYNDRDFEPRRMEVRYSFLLFTHFFCSNCSHLLIYIF